MFFNFKKSKLLLHSNEYSEISLITSFFCNEPKFSWLSYLKRLLGSTWYSLIFSDASSSSDGETLSGKVGLSSLTHFESISFVDAFSEKKGFFRGMEKVTFLNELTLIFSKDVAKSGVVTRRVPGLICRMANCQRLPWNCKFGENHSKTLFITITSADSYNFETITFSWFDTIQSTHTLNAYQKIRSRWQLTLYDLYAIA